MSYKIVLKRSFTSNAFAVSVPANNPSHARKVVQEMYEGYVILSVEPGACV